MIYFDTECPRIGDSISAVPFMLNRQMASGEIALVGPDFNNWAWDGLDVAENLQRATHAPPGAQVVRIHPQQSWETCHANGWHWHMSEGHFRHAGIEPVTPFSVPFVKPYEPWRAQSRYVISPFSVSDSNNNKKWPIDRWLTLIRIVGSGMAGLGTGITVIGSNDDDMRPFQEAGCATWSGTTLQFAVSMLRNCDCLITIDNGIGHLGTMLNMTNHVMIYSREVPRKFAETPFGVNVYGATTRDISVEAVIDAVRRAEIKQLEVA